MAAEKKPKAIKLGHGRLEFDGMCLMLQPDKLRSCCDALVALTEDPPSGTLLWLPDPPKPKTKRGKR